MSERDRERCWPGLAHVSIPLHAPPCAAHRTRVLAPMRMPCVCHATFDGFVRPILTHRICAPILTHRYPRFTSSAREPVLRADGAAVSAVVFDLYACPGLDFDQTPRTPRLHAAAIGMRVAYFSAPCRRTHARHTRAPHTRLFIFISMPPHTRVVVVSVWPSVWCWGA